MDEEAAIIALDLEIGEIVLCEITGLN